MDYKFKHDNLSQLIYAYKHLKGFELTDRVWDAAAWGRTAKSAKLLLALFKDDIDIATNFLEKFAKECTYSWTLKTVVSAKTDNFK